MLLNFCPKVCVLSLNSELNAGLMTCICIESPTFTKQVQAISATLPEIHPKSSQLPLFRVASFHKGSCTGSTPK